MQRLPARLARRDRGDGGDANGAPPAAPVQPLLRRLAAQMGQPKTYLKWIQAGVGDTIRMIPVDDVLFFISDEKYTRVQTAQFEALIRKPINLNPAVTPPAPAPRVALAARR